MSTSLLDRLVVGRRAWEREYNALVAFKRSKGHCNVRTNANDDACLGRWVAQQRHRKRTNKLQQWQVDLLDHVGFVWSATDNSWERMFRNLIAFKRNRGHCNVPALSKRHDGLATWVANQRHRRKIGTLQPQRLHKLDSIGFCWAVYSMPRHQMVRVAAPQTRNRQSVKAAGTQVRCYYIGSDRFVPYDGRGEKPKELQQYITTHNGEMPPYIPLPTDKTVFIIGDSLMKNRDKVVWKGKGALPPAVLHFVNENGALPPHVAMCSHG